MPYVISVLTVIAAYLIGSINFAVIFSSHFSRIDVRNFGSGNAGTTNVMRVSGAKAGVLTFVFDAAKGAAACAMGYFVFKYLVFGGVSGVSAEILHPIHGAFFCGIACMIGHCWPVFFQFRGGKAAATSVGIFAVCCYPACIAALLVFAAVFAVKRIVSLGTLAAAVAVVGVTVICAFTGFFGRNINPVIITVIAILAGIIVFARHKANIERLSKGEEKVITVKKE